MTPPDPPPPAAGWGEAAGACPAGACASAAVAAKDVAPAITAAAKNPRRGMQHGQSEKEARATVADMDGSGAKLRRLKLRAVGRCPYTSPRQPCAAMPPWNAARRGPVRSSREGGPPQGLAYGSAATVAPRSLAPARRQ